MHNIHLTGYRPWGTYTVLEDTPGYKIKRIEVKPGKRLSLQKHFHRNEHWVVVSGHSTLMAIKAIQKNKEEDKNYKCKHICVEPYEMPWLEKTEVDVVRKKVENVEISFFLS